MAEDAADLILNSYPKATFDYITDKNTTTNFIVSVADKVVFDVLDELGADFRSDKNGLMTKVKWVAEA